MATRYYTHYAYVYRPIIDEDGENTDYELELECNLFIEPYTPACISGPPENCYPAEGGYAILENAYLDWDGKSVDVLSCLTEKEIDKIEQQGYSRFCEHWEDRTDGDQMQRM